MLVTLTITRNFLRRWMKENERMSFLKKIVSQYNNTSLVLRIVIGLAVGLILALLVPQATWISIFGTLFVGALKAIAPVLVFVLVASSLAQSRARLGSQFTTIIALYLISTFLAAVVAVLASTLFPVTLDQLASAADSTAPSSIGEIFQTLLSNIVANPVHALANGNYLGILFWAVILGIALRNAADTTKTLLSNASEAVSTAVRWIINLAPFGILGLVFDQRTEHLHQLRQASARSGRLHARLRADH